MTGVRELRTYEIVGVAGDANYSEIREPARRAVYLPAFRTGYVVAQNFLIRTDIDPEGTAADVRRTIAAVLPGIPVVWMITLADQITPPSFRNGSSRRSRVSSAYWVHCWRVSGCMGCWLTRFRAAPTKSASAWLWEQLRVT